MQRYELEPGAQLPTEARLMDRYGVSRNTVRLALGLLRTEGLVVTGQGRGSFVADLAVPPRAPTPTERRALSGRTTSTVIPVDLAEPGDAEHMTISATIRPAPPMVAERLGLDTTDRVVERRRVVHHAGAPRYTADSYVPAAIAADSDIARPAALPEGILPVLEAAGCAVVHHGDEITVRMPSPNEAQQLGIATGVPVIALLRTGSDAERVAIYVTVALLPGDRHTLRYDLQPNG